ncbi:putative Relaxin receptor 2 [Hypsibius exemplaris]|uniref:Relaxin receptor 2 n=1 Tax=Hypsibius exemplaris TaxID=2072580 RepID=A0A1W0X1I9_HYPEX|nr:putative Relaxin receptor 2 [Hypsibius exemplaris]
MYIGVIRFCRQATGPRIIPGRWNKILLPMAMGLCCLLIICFTGFLLSARDVVAPKSSLIVFHSHHSCETGQFPCASSAKCLAQRYWCDEIKDCPLGDDEDERYCGEKTSGFGRHFIRRIVDLQEKDGCMAPEPLLPPGSMFHDHVGREGIQCFVGRYPKRCVCMVNRIRCDDLSLTQIFAFTNETADPQTPRYSFLHNRIQYIQEDVFRLLPDLRHLDFRKNSISGLNNRAFNGLSNLRRLHLDQNKLSRVDPRVFWPLTNLCFLWLGQNGIQSWEPHSFNNSKLRWLDLKANRITLEAGMFSKLNSLYYL